MTPHRRTAETRRWLSARLRRTRTLTESPRKALEGLGASKTTVEPVEACAGGVRVRVLAVEPVTVRRTGTSASTVPCTPDVTAEPVMGAVVETAARRMPGGPWMLAVRRTGKALHAVTVLGLVMFILSMGVSGGAAATAEQPMTTATGKASLEVAAAGGLGSRDIQGAAMIGIPCVPGFVIGCLDDVVPGGGSTLNPIDGMFDKIQSLMCFGTVTRGPEPVTPTTREALFGKSSPFAGSYTNKSVTVEEMYGTHGLIWSEYRPIEGNIAERFGPGCLINNVPAVIGNNIAGYVMNATNSITGITIAIYKAAANPDLLDAFNDPLRCIVAGCGGSKGLKQSLYLEYLTPVLMLGALWGGWVGLVRKQTVQAAQGGLWMVAACGVSLAFMAAPDVLVDETNSFVGEISSTVIDGVTQVSSNTVPRDDMCFITRSNKDRGIRMSGCSMYRAMAFTPWAAGQFGVSRDIDLTMPGQSVKVGNKRFDDARIVQLDAQAFSAQQWKEMGGTPRAYVVYPAKADEKREQWDDVREYVESGNADMRVWSGFAFSDRVNIALTGFVASLILGILVILISFSTVVLSVAMVLLVMMSPLFLLVGVHPGFGRGIALKWLELLIGTALKRIVLSLMLAILVGMYQIILETPASWLTQTMLVAAIGIGAIMYRKPLLETLNVVQLGGTQTGLENRGGGGQRQMRQAASAATGSSAGAIAAGLAGGGVAGVAAGAMRGGMMAGRSGSPVRAAGMGARYGSATGRRHANANRSDESRDRAEERRAQEQADYDNAPYVNTFDTDYWPTDAPIVIDPNNERVRNPNYNPNTRGLPRPKSRGPQRPQGGPQQGPQGPQGSGGSGGGTGGGSGGGSGPRPGGGSGGSGGSGPRPGGGAGGAGGGAGGQTPPSPGPAGPTPTASPSGGTGGGTGGRPGGSAGSGGGQTPPPAAPASQAPASPPRPAPTSQPGAGPTAPSAGTGGSGSPTATPPAPQRAGGAPRPAQAPASPAQAPAQSATPTASPSGPAQPAAPKPAQPGPQGLPVARPV